MSVNDYEFRSDWHATARCEDVYDILIDVRGYVIWWPQVYLSVNQIIPGEKWGVGKTAVLHTRGALPYTLRWNMRVIEANYPFGFTLEAHGDIEGRGIWSFTPVGGNVDIHFDWRLRAEKPILRHLALMFKPFFLANHRWAMARGQEGLLEELLRRNNGKAVSVPFDVPEEVEREI